jgi:hypothetical protein
VTIPPNQSMLARKDGAGGIRAVGREPQKQEDLSRD